MSLIEGMLQVLQVNHICRFSTSMLGDECRDIPKRFHFKKNKRVLPILVVAEPGYAFASRRETNAFLATFRLSVDILKKNPNIPFRIGLHGYDNNDRNVSTIFLAKGPAFKECVTMDPIEAVHVAPLIAHLL